MHFEQVSVAFLLCQRFIKYVVVVRREDGRVALVVGPETKYVICVLSLQDKNMFCFYFFVFFQKATRPQDFALVKVTGLYGVLE